MILHIHIVLQGLQIFLEPDLLLFFVFLILTFCSTLCPLIFDLVLHFVKPASHRMGVLSVFICVFETGLPNDSQNADDAAMIKILSACDDRHVCFICQQANQLKSPSNEPFQRDTL